MEHVTRFTIDVLGFDAQQTSDMLAGDDPRFSALLAVELAEVRSLTLGAVAELGDGVLVRRLQYELDPMVWRAIQDVLQVACPGLVRYTDTVYYSKATPGWRFTSEWAGVPGIPPSVVSIQGSGECEDDGPMGCRVTYEARVRCTIPIVGRMVERLIGEAFERTCRQVPGVMQKYFVML